MYFIQNNIYFKFYLLFVLFIPFGAFDTEILTLKMNKFIQHKLVKQKSALSDRIYQYIYVYKFTKMKDNVVNIACVAADTVTDTTLRWSIDSPGPTHTDCTSDRTRELNYITKLTHMENGNNLTCHLNSTVKATAKVMFQCPNCEKTENHSLSSRCYDKTDDIRTYVDGELYKEQKNGIVKRSHGQNITVHCQIKVDGEHAVGLNKDYRAISGFEMTQFSKSVVVYRVTMSDMLDNRKIVCVKKKVGSNNIETQTRVHFQLKSNFYVEISQSGEEVRNKTTHRHFTEVTYNDNDTITLTCIWIKTKDVVLSLEWLKDNKPVKQNKSDYRSTYEAMLTREDANSNMICRLGNTIIKEEIYILLKYNVIDQRTTLPGETQTEPNEITVTNTSIGIEWIGVGIAIIVLIAIIVFAAIRCCSRRSAAANVLRNEISYINFQNTYVVSQEPVVLEPTYAGPVDDVNMYSSTYNQKPPQDTYSTPFIPTLEEMYAKPTPKNSKLKTDPVYQLPGKFTYANLQSARGTQADPGYSNVSGDLGDSASETYTYCFLPEYSRPG